MGTPTRYTYGISTVAKTNTLGDFPMPHPFRSSSNNNRNIGTVVYANDFDTLIGTDYTVTGLSSTFALTSTVVGGAAVLTPGAATTASSAYKNGQFIQFIAGNKLWFEARFEISALAGTAYVGLQAGSATTDGLWFAVNASGVVSLVSTVGSTATTLVNNITTIAGATFVNVGIYYNGTDLLVFLNNAEIARVSAPTIGSSGTTLTNALLTPVYQITPTASQTLTVDYALVAQEVTR